MAFEKAKVLKAAEKSLAQGNLTAAIQEYRQLVDHEPDDFTALNMLGDLYVRTNKKDEAIACFMRIGEHYREQEFNLKAIAMFKKVDRLKPRNPEIAEKLANLYAIEGLIVDARAQYLIVADAYTHAGDSKKALEILHKIADLDPQNTEVRLKLADGYLREELTAQATEAFAEAGEHLYEQGVYEKALHAFNQALALRPHHPGALRGMVDTHVALGTAYEAAELLERLVTDAPGDLELISLLLQAQLQAQDAEGAERATSLLMAQDLSYYTRFIDVARLYLQNGDVDSAARVLASVTERVLAGREENQLLELVNEVLARNPEQITGLRLLVRIHWWQRDMEKLRAALDRLLDAAEAAGRPEDERYALTQLVRLMPDDARYEERLRALGGAQEDLGDENGTLSDNLTGVPTFESFAIVNDEPTPTPILLEPSAPVTEPAAFEFNSVEAEAVADPSASFADLNEELKHTGEPPVGVQNPNEFDFDGAIFAESSIPQVQSAPDENDPSRESLLLQELESVDFYIAQGYNDIAVDTLDMLERQFHAHPQIEMRRQKLRPSAESVARTENAANGEAEFEFLGRRDNARETISDATRSINGSELNDGKDAVVSPSPIVAGSGLDSGLADVFEEFRAAAEEESTPPTTDYETHYNMGIAYQEMDLLDDAVREFQTATALVHANDGTPRFLQCCNLLGHCFIKKGLPKAAVMWFRKGLDAPGHSQDEYQALRYELGLALEDMGDVNQAIDVFTEVYSIDVEYRDVGDKLRELQARK